jgi:hypothetical protein
MNYSLKDIAIRDCEDKKSINSLFLGVTFIIIAVGAIAAAIALLIISRTNSDEGLLIAWIFCLILSLGLSVFAYINIKNYFYERKILNDVLDKGFFTTGKVVDILLMEITRRFSYKYISYKVYRLKYEYTNRNGDLKIRNCKQLLLPNRKDKFETGADIKLILDDAESIFLILK